MGTTGERLHLKVGGMHCSLCEAAIRRALGRLEGVVEVSVSLAHAEVLVRYQPGRLDPARVVATLAALGYTPQEPDRADLWTAEERALARARRAALAMAGLAGLATLLMALAWWGGPGLLLAVGQAAITLVASLGPAAFVYRQAYQALRRGILNQDVLAAAAAVAGIVGGVVGLRQPAFPAGAFLAATTFILAFHTLGGYASVLVHVRASQSVRRLLALQPPTARRLEEGQERLVPVAALRPGDRVRVLPGERIPMDGRIVQGVSAVDLSLVTGEPLPVDRGPGDEVVGGSLNLSGALVVEVTRVGEAAFLRQVARQVAEARAMKPGVLRLVDRLLLIYVPVVFGLAVAGGLLWTLGAWLLTGQPQWERAGLAVLGALVMGYPCALGMATPLAIMRASGVAAERGILMRSGEAFQVLGQVSVVVFDKTGTVTEGRPHVQALWALDRPSTEVLTLAAVAERLSEHPLGRAIVDAASEAGLAVAAPEAFTAVTGQGVVARWRGQRLLVGTEALLATHGVGGLEMVASWAAAQRAQGATVVLVAVEERLVGALALGDRVRAEAPAVVAALRREGVAVYLATGDHPGAAQAVARVAGITHLFARLTPAEKRDLVRRLQHAGQKVAFVGDGLNDAPALMQADVGVAIGTGTDIALESADVVIPGHRLWAVVEARALARASYRLTVRNLLLALGVNATGVLAALTGGLPPAWAMAAMALSLSAVVGQTMAARLLPAREPGGASA